MMSFLTRIYPFKQSRHWLRDGFFYGLVIWAILYFLQPFGFCLYLGNKCLAAALFGMVTFVCYAIYIASVLKCFHRTVNPWRIWHEGIAVLGLIIMIAFCNFLLFSFLFHYTVTIRLFLLFLNWTIIVGIFLTLLSVGIQYNRSLRDRMEDLLHKTTQEQKEVIITIHDTSSRGNDLAMPINDLLYTKRRKTISLYVL